MIEREKNISAELLEVNKVAASLSETFNKKGVGRKKGSSSGIVEK